MKVFALGLAALLLAAPAVSMAGDKVTHLSFEAGVAAARRAGDIDGSVKFYLAGNGPRGNIVNDNVTINRKTNAFGKSDEETCNHVLATDLVYLQNEAKQAGANAVVDIVSNYNNNEYRDNQNFECHKGFLMSGVALKAKLAKIH
jgi:uncharacterized protein YbjQ (UPF0145 family)